MTGSGQERQEPTDLAAVEALCAAATPGPWGEDGPFWWPGPNEFRDATTVITGSQREAVCVMPRAQDRQPNPSDAKFIAVARTLLPQMVAELAALRAVVARLTAERDRARDCAVTLEQELARAVVPRVLAPAEPESSERIALRPDRRTPESLDDVVVRDVSMFRAEMLDKGRLWLCCYFPDSDERITFNVRAKKGRIEFDVIEQPPASEQFTYEDQA